MIFIEISEQNFNNITLGQWLEYWFETYKKPYLAKNSIRNIDQIIRLHIAQWLKDKPLRNINVFDIDKALAGIPPSRTLRYTKQTLNNAFNKACNLGILDRNVVSYTDKIKYRKKKSKALTIAEQNAFIQALEGRRIKWIMLFYLYTGVRREEALFIKWCDIDESQNLILIRGTKTEESYRYIVLTPDVKAILDGRKKQAENEKGTYLENKTDFVFKYSLTYVSRIFKQLCPNHHLHDLRHTYITRCAESGMNVSVCQQLVGHSTPALTMSIYTHVMDEYKRKEALKFTLNPDIYKNT